MQNIKELLDEVFQGVDEAYKNYLSLRQTPEILGKWQILDTLKYLCKKAENDPAKLTQCHPELLIELTQFLSICPGLLQILPEATQFITLLESANCAENDNVQLAVWVFKFGKNKLTLADLDKCKERVNGLLFNKNLSAQDIFFVGMFYYYKNDVTFAKEDNEEVEHLTAAAELQHSTAKLYLAQMYVKDRSKNVLINQLERDEKAVKWFEESAALGNAIAMYNLGIMYLNNRGGKEFPTEAAREKIAAEWLEKSAALGFSIAKYNIGILYVQKRAGKELAEKDRLIKARLYLHQALSEYLLNSNDKRMSLVVKAIRSIEKRFEDLKKLPLPEQQVISAAPQQPPQLIPLTTKSKTIVQPSPLNTLSEENTQLRRKNADLQSTIDELMQGDRKLREQLLRLRTEFLKLQKGMLKSNNSLDELPESQTEARDPMRVLEPEYSISSKISAILWTKPTKRNQEFDSDTEKTLEGHQHKKQVILN